MNKVLTAAITESRQPMEYEVYQILEQEGITMPPHHFVADKTSLEAVMNVLDESQKYVVKAMSPMILHKSDMKAVKLKITKSEIPAEFREMEEKFKEFDFRGILIVPMVEDGIEIIIGSTVDPTFGNILVFGLGGILVEALKDVRFAKIPLNYGDATLLIDSIKNKELFNGPRGLPKLDRVELAQLLVKISEFADKYRDFIREIDLNPVRITYSGLVPLDARVILYRGEDVRKY